MPDYSYRLISICRPPSR